MNENLMGCVTKTHEYMQRQKARFPTNLAAQFDVVLLFFEGAIRVPFVLPGVILPDVASGR
jgi:hypothetical protein